MPISLYGAREGERAGRREPWERGWSVGRRNEKSFILETFSANIKKIIKGVSNFIQAVFKA